MIIYLWSFIWEDTFSVDDLQVNKEQTEKRTLKIKHIIKEDTEGVLCPAQLIDEPPVDVIKTYNILINDNE